MPVQSALLFAVVLACPLMMLLMMGGGHAGHGTGHDHDQTPSARDEADQPTNPAHTHRHGS